jgi:hypothetical protein
MTYGYYLLRGLNLSKNLDVSSVIINLLSHDHPYSKSLSRTMTIDAHCGISVKIYFIEIHGFNQYTSRSTDGRCISVENCIISGGNQMACARVSASQHGEINRSLERASAVVWQMRPR